MARGKPSTLQDIEAGRLTEVEIFAGRVIEPGGQHGTPTPIDETAYHVIRRLGG
jgi:2-dehydropantoate 2-reductase